MTIDDHQFIKAQGIPSGEQFGNATILFEDIKSALQNDSRVNNSWVKDIVDWIRDKTIDDGVTLLELMTDVKPPEWLNDMWPIIVEILKLLIM